MNEEITEKTQTLAPFTKLCMTIGNLPSSYFESMSYYEQLIWFTKYLQEQVIPAVNQNAAAVEELQRYYIELQDYVNHYFDNLDLQEEVNIKLNEMATDGTLTNLIKGYVDPIYEAFETTINEEMGTFKNGVNSSLSSMQSQINGVASGSPAGIYETESDLTTDNPDHSKIYLVLATGKWYYYDTSTSSWTAGGTYQSTGYEENSIHYLDLDNELQNSFVEVSSITNEEVVVGIVNADGSINSSNPELGHFSISVTPGDTYKLHIYYPSNVYSTSTLIAYMFKNNSNEILESVTKADVTIVDNYFDVLITIPLTASTLLINTMYQVTNRYVAGSYVNKITNYKINNISRSQFDSTLQSIFVNNFEEVTPSTFINNGYISANGVINSIVTLDIKKVSVNPGEIYKITSTQAYDNPIVMFTTNNNITTYTKDGTDYDINNITAIIKSEEIEHSFVDYEFTIPEYCNVIYLNVYKSGHTFSLSKVSSYKLHIEENDLNINKLGFNNLIAIGDSITEVNFRALHNYLYWIQNDMPQLTIQNLGRSGTGYKAGANTFIDRITDISNYDIDNDIIIVMGSVNDKNYIADNLGELGDTTTDTLYGSMYQFFNTLFTSFNGVRIGCISPINWKFAGAEKSNLQLYIKALEDTCNLFNVPFLNISNITNLRPENSTFLNEYYEADGTGSNHEIDNNGVHPNSEGHKLFYGRVKEFIMKL